MSTGLLFDHDQFVADYLTKLHGWKSNIYNRVIGLLDKDGMLKGGVIFTNWNGSNVELSYYGQDTLTLGVVRCLACFILHTFDPARLTVTTSKRNKRLIKAILKIGFKLEGTQRCYYGKQDITRNTGVRFVMFRDGIETIARFKPRKAQVC